MDSKIKWWYPGWETFTWNDKKLGGVAGFTAILHTHSRMLEYHPNANLPAVGRLTSMIKPIGGDI